MSCRNNTLISSSVANAMKNRNSVADAVPNSRLLNRSASTTALLLVTARRTVRLPAATAPASDATTPGLPQPHVDPSTVPKISSVTAASSDSIETVSGRRALARARTSGSTRSPARR